MSADRLDVAREVARRWVASGETTGLVVLFARRGTVVWEEAFGTLTPAPDAPALTSDALFPLASVSKPITAAALMCLVEDGLVGLHRPVQEYLPEFLGGGKDAVTPRHLLTHTAGIDDEALARRVAAVHPAGGDVSQWVAAACDEPLGAPPGTRWAYSTAAYLLVATIIERVSGRAFPAFLRDRLLEPLGMTDTYVGLASAPPERLARRYWPAPPADGYGASLETAPPGDAFGAVATAGDTARFGHLFLARGRANGARVLAPATVEAMMRNHVTGLGLRFDDEEWPTVSWGLGWHVRGEGAPRRGASLGSPRTIDHQGYGGAHLWVDPEAEVVGVVLSLLRRGAPGFYPGWRSDLLANAVIAAVEA
jgi:CubicO group peptidase (beta-lactamase class C family)